MTTTLAETGGECLAVERVSDIHEFERLKTEWNELLEASAVNCLFLTWEWLYTWWKHLRANRKLWILTVRREGKLTGLAPLALRPPSLMRSHPLPVVEFLGSGFAGSDYLDFIIRRGCEPESLRALAGKLAPELLMIELGQLKRGVSLAERAIPVFAAKGWRASLSVSNVCPFISLEGHSWESYLGQLGSEHRYNVRRKLRRMEKEFDAQFEEIKTEGQLGPALEEVVRLHHLRWDVRGGSDAFHTSELLAFHQEFAQIALGRGWLRLYLLRLDGAPVAGVYGFLYRRVFYFYQSGFDPAYSKNSVGLAAIGLSIKSAIAEGALEYDFLHGGEEYKSRWSRQSRDLLKLELYPPRAWGWLYRSSLEIGRASRAVARRVLPQTVVNRLTVKAHRSSRR
jgi:CelD/BcsL family acetyltransferase involved in cellulose biosynthesis